jgi:hypothetical protein
MLNPKATKAITLTLAIICCLQALWIWSELDTKPKLSKVILDIPVNDHMNVYGALQDSGGATVPFIYNYYILTKGSGNKLLHNLENSYPFLRSREPATIRIDQGYVKAEVHGQILDFSSRAIYRQGEVKYLDIDLNAIQPR